MNIYTGQQILNQTLLLNLRNAGYEITTSDHADNYIPGLTRISNALNTYLKANNPLKAANLKLELATKDGLSDAIQGANLNVVKTVKEASLINIQNFGVPFIIKPNNGFGSNTMYAFVYKVFADYNEFASSVNLTDFNTNFIDTEVYKHYIIQQSLLDTNGEVTQVFVSGFINTNSDKYIECHHTVKMEQDSRNDNLSVAASAYPSKFKRTTDSYSDPTSITDTYGVLAQLEQLFKFYNIKSVPFQCQAIVDPTDSTKAYITDFVYKLRPQNFDLNINHDYLVDKFNFMFKGDAITIPNTTHTYYPQLDLSKGITYELEEFCYTNNMIIACNVGIPENKRSIPFVVTGSSKAEVDTKLQNLKDFISTY
jgi:hypothetical protein